MNNLIKKVGRVKTVSEAVTLEKLGANLIGFSLSDNFKFKDERVVTEETVLSIQKVLKRVKTFGEIFIDNSDTYDVVKLAKRLNFDYIQPVGQTIPSLPLRETLFKENIGIIYSNIEVSHDEYPTWILSRYQDEKNLNVSFFQIDLLPEYQNSWYFLNNESPEYPEEIQIDDISELGIENPLLLTLNFNTDNIFKILDKITSIKGIGMEMGNNPTRDDFHYLKYFEVIEILRELQKRNTILNV